MKATCLLSILLMTSFSHAGIPTEPQAGERTDRPQLFVMTHSESPDGGIVQFDCSQCSAMKNLLFIASTAGCGNSGCDFFVFRPDGKSYYYLTTLFVDTGGFQFLKSKHHGMNDLLNYRHLSADEGTVTREEFDGRFYRCVGEAKKIKSTDFEKYLSHPEPVKRVFYSKDLKELAK